jgi:hypothetical protein
LIVGLAILVVSVLIATVVVSFVHKGVANGDDGGGGNGGDGTKLKIEVLITGVVDSVQVGKPTPYYEAELSNATDGEIKWGWKVLLSGQVVSDYGTFSNPDSNWTNFTATKVGAVALMANAVYQGETYEATVPLNITQDPPEPELTISISRSQLTVGDSTDLEAIVTNIGAAFVTYNWTVSSNAGTFGDATASKTTFVAGATPVSNATIEVTATIEGQIYRATTTVTVVDNDPLTVKIDRSGHQIGDNGIVTLLSTPSATFDFVVSGKGSQDLATSDFVWQKLNDDGDKYASLAANTNSTSYATIRHKGNQGRSIVQLKISLKSDSTINDTVEIDVIPDLTTDAPSTWNGSGELDVACNISGSRVTYAWKTQGSVDIVRGGDAQVVTLKLRVGAGGSFELQLTVTVNGVRLPTKTQEIKLG